MAEGFFRSKKGFTVVQNEIIKDTRISLKAKGLYLVIQAYITMPDRKWTKNDFLHMAKEGTKAFDSAWKELKDGGYLKVHIMADGGRWHTEYELLDEPDAGPHTLYHNKDGEITSDNLRRAEKKKEKESELCHYPQNGSNGADEYHYPHFGSNANGSNDNGCNANGGNKNKDLYTIPDNKSNVLNPNLNHISGEKAEKYSMAYLERHYGSEDMIQMGVDRRDVEMVMEILYDALNTTKETIWIKREEKPARVVKSRLLKLGCMDIIYALEQYHRQTTEIRHQKAYMLSILYEAKGQGHLDYANQVQHDFYGKGGEGG